MKTEKNEHSGQQDRPWVTVIIVNYNGADWVSRCLDSLAAQTIFARTQIIIVDNLSTDGSDRLSQQLTEGWSNAEFIQIGCNRGFGGGGNVAAKHATGKYLFFLNPDVWLERECLEQLYVKAESDLAGAVGLLIMNYEDNTVQSTGTVGFDFCGYLVQARDDEIPEHPFSAAGFYFIRRDLFELVGGHDKEFFLYGEELDLSWRLWIAGENIVSTAAARIHHRGAATENPKGGTRIVELRTSDSKRYYANRNHLLTIIKNSHHLLLLLLFPTLGLMALEGIMGALLLRRWSFFSRSFWAAVCSCWSLRAHLAAERQRVAQFRKRGDVWFLRFLSWRFNRLDEYKKIGKLGLPKVTQR